MSRLDAHGYEATHITYNSDGTDEHGDITWSTSTETVDVYVSFNTITAASRTLSARGKELSVDVMIYVNDDVDVTDIDDSDRPDRFIVNGTTYEVIQAQQQRNGLVACISSRT